MRLVPTDVACVVDVRGLAWMTDTRGFLEPFLDRRVDDIVRRTAVFSGGGRPTFETSKRHLEPAAFRLPPRRAILTDAGVVGEMETCVALLRHHGLAHVVGTATGGNPGRGVEVNLGTLITMEWTGERIVLPGGRTVSAAGVPPDYPARLTLDGLRQGRDDVLERAIEILSSR